ncbi:MAG: proline--tRNA ligase [Candidatus Hodarchaeota archaeon]
MTKEMKQRKNDTADQEETVTFHYDKVNDFSNWFTEINKRAELSDQRYGVKGLVVYRSWTVVTLKIMYRLLEEALERTGHLPIIFPALIPKSNLVKEAEHVEGFNPEVFWCTRSGDNNIFEEPLALRPTSESAIYPMYSLWLRSWRDLPFKRYQSVAIWRYDTKMTRPFLRGREFYWIEAHNVFATQKEAENQVLEDLEITTKFVEGHLGMPVIVLKRPQWDKFAGAVYTVAAESFLPNGRFIQNATTHMLGDNFAKAYSVKYVDENEQEHYAQQTCYGPGLSRMYGAMLIMHGDDDGLILPFALAPIQVVIIPIPKKGAKVKVLERCQELKNKLRKAGLRVQLDDTDRRPGDKYYYWEMRGVPLRLEVGNREVDTNTATIFRRDLRTRDTADSKKIVQVVRKIGEGVTKELRRRAQLHFDKAIQDTTTIDEIREVINVNRVARINFCTLELEGITCAEKIKDETGAEVRGSRLDIEEKPTGNCPMCGKKATVVVYVGKSY